jgi:DNA integrity scanning protein disA
MKKKEPKKKILEYVFSILAPGTPLRSAIDRVQEASLGAIVVLGDPSDLSGIIRGGFKLNTPYTPQKLYELSKMDGGIILSEDIKTIYGANIQLQPNSNIKTDESGTRHQSAHRVAKQTGNLVITVSERRNKITIYKGEFRYTLHDIGDLLVKSSQAMTALEKYAVAISKNLINLTVSEFDNMVTLYDIVEIIRMYGLLFRMSDELIEYISELGAEGRLVKIQYQEIMLNQDEEFTDLIRDYKKNDEKVEKVMENLRMLNKEELLEDENIVEILGYNLKNISLDEIINSRGYRILGTINKVTKKDIEMLVAEFTEIQAILMATAEEMTQVKGISKLKAEHINKALIRLRNRVMLDRY